jgi:hypothetical protein
MVRDAMDQGRLSTVLVYLQKASDIGTLHRVQYVMQAIALRELQEACKSE